MVVIHVADRLNLLFDILVHDADLRKDLGAIMMDEILSLLSQAVSADNIPKLVHMSIKRLLKDQAHSFTGPNIKLGALTFVAAARWGVLKEVVTALHGTK